MAPIRNLLFRGYRRPKGQFSTKFGPKNRYFRNNFGLPLQIFLIYCMKLGHDKSLKGLSDLGRLSLITLLTKAHTLEIIKNRLCGAIYTKSLKIQQSFSSSFRSFPLHLFRACRKRK